MENLIFQVLVLFVCIHAILSSAGNIWGYDGDSGPDYWHLDFPHCGGVRQSPISVDTEKVIVDSDLLVPLNFTGYDSVNQVKMTLENNGHTVQVDLEGGGLAVSSGGLFGTYKAKQFHFHWGADDNRGSEHDINGHHFPMEMHIVHFAEKYGNFSNAVDKEDGLAVLGFFFEIGKFNPHFNEMIEHFGQIAHKDDHVRIASFPLRTLLPKQLDVYFRYFGSLTTPPCYESVIWTLFQNTIQISMEQVEAFRHKVHQNYPNETSRGISDDYRPPQCLNRRRVYASHPVILKGLTTEKLTNKANLKLPNCLIVYIVLVNVVALLLGR